MDCQLERLSELRFRCTVCGGVVSFQQPPKPPLRVHCFGAPASTEPGGLGGRVEAALSFLGITKDRVEAWVGGPCGCEERKQKLNALGEWASSAVNLGKEWGLARLREIGAIE